MYESVEFVNGGKFTSRGVWKHPERRIDTTEIIIVTMGKIYIALDGIEYELAVGDVLRISEGVLHGGTRESCETVSFYWLHFKGGDSECLPPVLSRPESIYQTELLARQILHYSNTEGYPRQCGTLLLHVLLVELGYARGVDESSGYKLYCEIKEWVRANCDMPIKVSDVAERFSYNPDYVNRVFKKYCKDGLKAYIDQMKMQRIKHDLVCTDMPLKELAQKYGFAEYKYFLKYFKYHEGATPREYTRAYYNIHTNTK